MSSTRSRNRPSQTPALQWAPVRAGGRRALSLVGVVLCAAAIAASAAAVETTPAVNASAFVVSSSVDGSTLAARAADQRRPMASITKLMTVLVARRATRLDETVVVPAAAARVGESTMFLRAGQRVTVRDLLIGALVPSANDAATTLAHYVGQGSVARFVARMNATAAELGLTATRYANPHGLDEAGHYSSARDSAVLLDVALRDPFIRRFAGAATARLSSGRVVESTDNLIGVVEGFVGGKTGHTAGAGWSQVARAKLDGIAITATVLGAPTEARRDADLAALLRFGLGRYRVAPVVQHGRVYARVEVGWGNEPITLVAPDTVRRAVATTRPLVEQVVAPQTARLPIVEGQRLGTITIRDGSRIVARAALVADRSVAAPSRLGKIAFVAGRTLRRLVRAG